MTTLILPTLAIALVAWLSWFGRKALEQRRRKRMSDNAYSTALTLWNFARIIKDQLDEVSRGRASVIDFTNISVPAGTGYNICLELAAYGFRIHAVPEKYLRTGRISLYVDDALTVRAWDRGGENATADDPEYTGEDLPVETPNGSKRELGNREEVRHAKESMNPRSLPAERVIMNGDAKDRRR